MNKRPTDDELREQIAKFERLGYGLRFAPTVMRELLAARALLREAAEGLASVDEDACAHCGEQRMTSPMERLPLIARLRAAGGEHG